MSKKPISLLLAVCMLFCLSACGTMEISEGPTNTSYESQTEALQNTDEITSTERENNQASSNTEVTIENDTTQEQKPSTQSKPTSTASQPTHSHSFSNATCTSPKKCSCGATSGTMLGHSYSNADCITPKKCTRCGVTAGTALGHQFSAATCTSPQICSRCGATNGKALGHSYSDANCNSPKTCTRCGQTSGSALGHKYVNNKCSRCGKDDPDSLIDVDGNPYTTHKIIDGETFIYYDYSTVYDTLDLSQYNSWGTFGEDGLMWVEKSDYKGKQFGYIDYKGNIIIPFTSKIKEPGDFASGYAIVACEYDGSGMHNGLHAVINTKGETVFEFVNHAVSLHFQSLNGNIVFIDINLIEDIYSSETKDYIFCSNTGKFIEIVEEKCSYYSSRSMVYSNGLLRTYRTDWNTPNKNNDVGYIEVVTFYDEDGAEALTIDTNSSEYYKSLLYVEDFVDEKSVVYFWGHDRNYYKVEIDKSGKWIGEPVKIDEGEVKRF